MCGAYVATPTRCLLGINPTCVQYTAGLWLGAGLETVRVAIARARTVRGSYSGLGTCLVCACVNGVCVRACVANVWCLLKVFRQQPCGSKGHNLANCAHMNFVAA